MQLYLCGLTEDQEGKLIRVVNQGGGVRYSQLSDTVTHVIMGERQAGVLDRARELGSG